MTKKIVNLLIITMLLASAKCFAVVVPCPVLPADTPTVSAKTVGDTATTEAKASKKPKKVRSQGRKVTFENFDQQYARALRYYNNGQYLSAAGLFENLYPLSLGTEKADTILFLFAQSYYKNGDYDMAAFHFRDYARRYPNTTRTEDAFYYGICAIYNSSPEYSLDQSNTEFAIEQIKAFLQAYPNSSHTEECNVMLDAMRTKLARKDLEILILYYDTDHYEACQIAAKNFFNDYSYSPLMPEAIYYLVLNNLEYAKRSVESKKKERYTACLDACNRLLLNYPENKYTAEVNKIALEARKQLNGK